MTKYSIMSKYFNKVGYRKHLPGVWKSKKFWKRYSTKYRRRQEQSWQ